MQEFEAGPGQRIVIYEPPDTGTEIDPSTVYEAIAADAATRAAAGSVLVSLAPEHLRHSALYMGRAGSGFESKVAVVAVYRDVAGAAAGSTSGSAG